MPILFKSEFVEPILCGEKTVTRRRWTTPRLKVGRTYQARTTLFGTPFAYLRILSIREERFPGAAVLEGQTELSERHLALRTEAEREGFQSWTPRFNEDSFYCAWMAMHGLRAMDEPCYRILFEVVQQNDRFPP